MSGVEISTFVHQSADGLIEDLKERRQELCEVSEGLIVPLGHLLDYDTPTNTCALQFHIGNLEEPEKVYTNLVHFLPLLFLIAANSPAVAGRYFGKSWRLVNSYAVGPLQKDWAIRFQDLIFAKRTKTLELRCFDPIWDIERIAKLAQVIEAIANLKFGFELDIEAYNSLREKVAINGYIEELDQRYQHLSEICDINKQLFKVTPADVIWKHYQKHGLEATYSALDYAYSHSDLKIQEVKRVKKNIAKIMTGFAAYYIPKLPYDAWKYIREK